ncbi:membrane protein [Kitasatospora sp. MMS16-BH015]|uniref:SHOCT domain-containing protein n=1 Tax=Kitasatospora sp. MMS16-BH015 TaxID=2018025 RepID=UPI000CA13E2A|nr:SHOCT domain-containing protein [Kitasatospora sp. MMS16-BH015]AUG76318.1 membrane protein [Kitasatospora sp. MMS16-BH015]
MDNYPLLNLFWTMLEFFLWILWFFLLFKVISDIFRSHDMSGWGKAGWMVLVILLPLLGVLVYVIVRGKSMGERDLAQARRSEEAFQSYVRQAAGTGPSHADELAKLGELRSKGVLSEEEFQKAKEKLLA